jgi:hypothetical protein
MKGKQSFFVAAGVTAVLFVGVSYTFLQKQSVQLRDSRLESRLQDEQQTALVKANKDIQKYAELEKIANSVVPQDKDQAKTVREIVAIANDSNVSISSINFPSSNLGLVVPKATSGSSSSSSQKVTTPPLSQVKQVDGIPGVYQMEVNVQSDSVKPIPYSSLIDFLSRLEKSRRTAQVSTITITPSTKDITKVTFSLSINVFIKP